MTKQMTFSRFWDSHTILDRYSLATEVADIDPRHVWTVLDRPGAEIAIRSGVWHIDSLEYLVTSQPWEHETEISK